MDTPSNTNTVKGEYEVTHKIQDGHNFILFGGKISYPVASLRTTTPSSPVLLKCIVTQHAEERTSSSLAQDEIVLQHELDALTLFSPEDTCYSSLLRPSELSYAVKIPSAQTLHLTSQCSYPLVLAALVFDGTGVGLPISLHKLPFDIETFLGVAIEICGILDEIHKKGVVHGLINPENIFFNNEPTTTINNSNNNNTVGNRIHIGGFHISKSILSCCSKHKDIVTQQDISRVFKSEHADDGVSGGGPLHEDFNEADYYLLEYISPEQTNRTDHIVDFSSDFYSLGALFYTMLTGHPPFEYEGDALQLIHAIIARPPPPLPSHFGALGDVVATLLAKAPANRYQSWIGLKADLITCQQRFRSSAPNIQNISVPYFTLKTKDFVPFPHLRDHLYGRQAEVEVLNNAMESIKTKSQVIFISGMPGAGKTTLVNMLYKSLRQHGLYASGKFDEYYGSLGPFGVIVGCVKSLLSQAIMQLATSNGHRAWGEALKNVCGLNGRLFLEFFPQLEEVIGPQPDLEDLAPTERKYRFHMLIVDLLTMLLKTTNIILFCDDLQWADPGSLELLEAIMAGCRTGVLLIGAYRDAEALKNQALQQMVKKFQHASDSGTVVYQSPPFGGTPKQTSPPPSPPPLNEGNFHNFSTIHLGSLNEESMVDMVSESLHLPKAEGLPLATVIIKKTGGNPLFASRFLEQLYRQSVIHFSWETMRWECDMDEVVKMDITENVVEFLIETLNKSPSACLSLLKFASLLGNQFDVRLLQHFPQFLPGKLKHNLAYCVRERFLIIVTENDYRFAHDKVREAAYKLNSEQDKVDIHYAVGMYLLNSGTEEAGILSLTHLNAVQKLFEHDEEIHRRVLDLNITAANSAKRAASYENALNYVKAGSMMLLESDWEKNHALAFAMKVAHAECEYLSGDRSEAQALFAEARKRAKTKAEETSVYQLEMSVLCTNSAGYSEATLVGIKCCALLGFNLPAKPTTESTMQLVQEIDKLLDTLSFDTILAKPDVTDPIIHALLNVLAALSTYSFFVDTDFFSYVSSFATLLTLKHGAAPGSAVSICWWTLFYGPKIQNTKRTYQLGLYCVDLCERFKLNTLKSKVYFLFPFSAYGELPLQELFPYYVASIEAGVRAGDMIFASYSANHIINNMFWIGQPLPNILRESTKYLKWIRETARYRDMVVLHSAALGFVKLLMGLTYSETTFDSDGAISEEDANPSKPTEQWVAIHKAEALFLFGNYKEALAHANRALELVGYLGGHLHEPRNYAISALIRLRLTKDTTMDRSALVVEAMDLQKKLDYWTVTSPHNFAHYDKLISAELARVEGNLERAMKHYNDALLLAQTHHYVQHQALAHELSILCLEELGFTSLATIALEKAICLYSKWGATQKVKYLERVYHHLSPHANYIAPIVQLHGTIPLTTSSTLSIPTLSSANNLVGSVYIPKKEKPLNSSGGNHVSPHGVGGRTVTSKLKVFASDDSLDAVTIVKASQVLSQEISLPQLLKKFVHISGENVGAERGAVILLDNTTPTYMSLWHVTDPVQISSPRSGFKGSGGMSSQQRHFNRSHEIDKTSQKELERIMAGACKRVVLTVVGTKKSVIVDSYEWSDFYDPTDDCRGLPPIGSILCVPILHSGNVTGVIYLEHSNQKVFKDNRLQLLELLSAQVSISIENSRLYSAAQSNEYRYRMLSECVPNLVWSTDGTGHVDFINSKWLEYTGMGIHETDCCYFEHNKGGLIHPDDWIKMVMTWRQCLETGETFNMELRLKRALDNAYRWTLCRALPVFDRTIGRIVKWVGSNTDIDDEKRKKENQEAELRYRVIAEAIPLIVWTADANGEINYVNKRWTEYTGMGYEESLGNGWTRALANYDVDMQLWKRGFMTGLAARTNDTSGVSASETNSGSTVRIISPMTTKPSSFSGIRTVSPTSNGLRTISPSMAPSAYSECEFGFEAQLRSANGTYRWHLIHGTRVPSSLASPQWLGTAIDIDDQKQAVMAIVASREAAELSAKNQSAFLANMSHEIRTPLNGMSGMLQLLGETELNSEQRDYVETMQRSSYSLLSIINDILDFSKIRAGKVVLVDEEVDIERLVEGVCEALGPLAANKGIELSYLVHRNTPRIVHGDNGKLCQILMNLVGNAIKFTNVGEVFVECVLDKWVDEDHPQLRFDIRDTGVGISEDASRHLFSPFYQVDSSLTRKHGGTGLGLVICKQLVQLFNGDICVQTEEGVGSTFMFTVQLSMTGGKSMIDSSLSGSTDSLDSSTDSLSKSADSLSRSTGSFNRSTECSKSALLTSSQQLRCLERCNILLMTKLVSSKGRDVVHHLHTAGCQNLSVTNNDNDALRILKDNAITGFDFIIINCNICSDINSTLALLKDTITTYYPSALIVVLTTAIQRSRVDCVGLMNRVRFLIKPLSFNKLVKLLLQFYTPTSLSPLTAHSPALLFSPCPQGGSPSSPVFSRPSTPPVASPAYLSSDSTTPPSALSQTLSISEPSPVSHPLSPLTITSRPTTPTSPIQQPSPVILTSSSVTTKSLPHPLASTITSSSSSAVSSSAFSSDSDGSPMTSSVTSSSSSSSTTPRTPVNPLSSSTIIYEDFLDALSPKTSSSTLHTPAITPSLTPLAPGTPSGVKCNGMYVNRAAGIPNSNSCEDIAIAAAAHSSSVLVVEDNLVNQKVMAAYLKKRGMKVTVANNGLEAVEIIKNRPPAYFIIIFMDIFMPEMDGFAATKEIRKWEAQQEENSVIPKYNIIALTANVLQEITQQCSEAGMDGYLYKPVEFSKLDDQIRKIQMKT